MGEHHTYEDERVDVSAAQHPHLHGEEGEIGEDVEDDGQEALANCIAVVLGSGQGETADFVDVDDGVVGGFDVHDGFDPLVGSPFLFLRHASFLSRGYKIIIIAYWLFWKKRDLSSITYSKIAFF